MISIGIRGGSRIFEGGGGEDIHKHTHPLDIVRVTSSALRKIEKHSHSWTFTNTHPPPWTLAASRHPPSEKLKNTPTLGHSQAPPSPPPLDIARVTSSTFQGGGGWSVTVTHTLHRFSVSGQVRGGGDHPCHPTPLDPPLGSILGLQAKKRGGGSKRGSNFGPNVKKPTSWPKRRGGGSGPPGPPPPWIRYWVWTTMTRPQTWNHSRIWHCSTLNNVRCLCDKFSCTSSV